LAQGGSFRLPSPWGGGGHTGESRGGGGRKLRDTMADDGGEDPQGNLAEERNQILQLQSEQARKKEQLDRLVQKSKALEDELEARVLQLEDVRNEHAIEQRRSSKATEGLHAQTAEARRIKAESEFMDDEVRRILQDRIPIMAAIPEEGDDGDAGLFDHQNQPQEDVIAEKIHDTVLVSYIQIEDGKQEDFKVSYRFDKDTTVEQLHKDACSYWACSHHEYCLCRIINNDVLQISDKGSERLHEPSILPPSEQAHLHLVQKDEIELFKREREKARRKEELREAQASTQQAQEHGADVTLKTMKIGLGYTSKEKPTEPFVEALKPWPGVYHLLKTRDRSSNPKWKRTRLSDFIVYGILCLLTAIVIHLRSRTDMFLLREGVAKTLVEGIEGEASPWLLEPDVAAPAWDMLTPSYSVNMTTFHNIRSYDEIWAWLGGAFHYQVFHPHSTLREFYMPVGLLRVRQQKAQRKECDRIDVPLALQKPCYYIYVNPKHRDTKTIILQKESWVNMTDPGNGTGRETHPDPLVWQPGKVNTVDLYGYMQHTYDGSGYEVDYNLSPQNITMAGTTFKADLGPFRSQWVDTRTRMLVVELTLANYNLKGYVAVSFMFELAPSGAVYPSANINPFHIDKTPDDNAADVLDVFRFLIVLFHIILFRVFQETLAKVKIGKGGFGYIVSFGGFVDMTTVALFFALQYMRLMKSPPTEPSAITAFYSYSFHAHVEEQLRVCESSLFLVLMIRYSRLFRLIPSVFRFFKMFSNSTYMMAYFCTLYIPIFLGTVFWAHSIWSPYVQDFSTWTNTLSTLLLSAQSLFDLEILESKNRPWTMPFLVYFFLSTSAFFFHMFLAITVHSYFEVELLESSTPNEDRWSPDQWMDWMLIGPIYTKLTGNAPGSSAKVGYREGGEDEDSDSSSDEDDEAGAAERRE